MMSRRSRASMHAELNYSNPGRDLWSGHAAGARPTEASCG
jgi:hypothetical protein